MNAQVLGAPVDVWIKCKGCGEEFLWTAGEQQYYREKKISPPKNCKTCRARRKAEDAERDKRAEEALGSARKETGTVEEYDTAKGFGWLTVDSQRRDEPELFFHCSALRCKQREIKPGVRVAFYIVDSTRKPGAQCAAHVTLAENGEK